jgi:hypothetical protein
MKNLLIIPLTLAGLSLFVVGPLYGFLVRVFTDFRPWGWLYDIGRRASFMASILAELILNDVLLKPHGYTFGHQTISAVLGANLKAGTLSKTGKKLQQLLDYIEEDHCIKAYHNIQTP